GPAACKTCDFSKACRARMCLLCWRPAMRCWWSCATTHSSESRSLRKLMNTWRPGNPSCVQWMVRLPRWSWSQCGLAVRPSDGGALAGSVRLLLADPSRCRALGKAGAAWARARFARSRLMGAYVDLLEGLSDRKAQLPHAAEPPPLEHADLREP